MRGIDPSGIGLSGNWPMWAWPGGAVRETLGERGERCVGQRLAREGQHVWAASEHQSATGLAFKKVPTPIGNVVAVGGHVVVVVGKQLGH